MNKNCLRNLRYVAPDAFVFEVELNASILGTSNYTGGTQISSVHRDFDYLDDLEGNI